MLSAGTIIRWRETRFVAVLYVFLCCSHFADADMSTSPPPGAGRAAVTYYVSPAGNDSKLGTSPAEAWRSLSKVASSVFHPGDAVLFEGGKQFAGCLFLSPGVMRGSHEAPVIIGSYGKGQFTLKADCGRGGKAAIDISGVSDLVIQDFILSGNSGNAPYGIWIHNPSSEIAKNITIQRGDISGFYTKAENENGAEIFVTGYPGAGLDGVKLIDNVLHGASGPMSPDNNGIYGFGHGKNITNVLYQGNIIYDIGGKAGGVNGAEGNGIIANGVNGGIIQYNLAYNLGANVDTCGGPTGLWAYNSSHITIQFNEVYNVKPTEFRKGCDWDGFDLDGYVTDSVIQYNYAHDNWGAGLALYIDGEWARNTVRYNVAINNAASTGATYFGNIVIANGEDAPDLRIYNNTLISNGPENTTAGISIQGNPRGAIIANNLIVSLNSGNFFYTGSVNPEVKIQSNNYYAINKSVFRWVDRDYLNLDSWRAATGHETIDGKNSALMIDPEFDYSGRKQTCAGYKRACPAVALKVAPKLFGAGADLSRSPYRLDVGDQDYAGNKIPNGAEGTGYNIGAYGGLPLPTKN